MTTERTFLARLHADGLAVESEVQTVDGEIPLILENAVREGDTIMIGIYYRLKVTPPSPDGVYEYVLASEFDSPESEALGLGVTSFTVTHPDLPGGFRMIAKELDEVRAQFEARYPNGPAFADVTVSAVRH